MEGKNCIGFVSILWLVWQVHAQVNCPETGGGRFTDGSDSTCKSYTLCVLNTATNTYVSFNYTCPSTSVFNPNTAACTLDYVCNVTNISEVEPVCTEEGFVADPTSINCTSYIGCVKIGGIFEYTTYTCPDSTFYDPATTLCVADYNCTSSDFTCTVPGRFPNRADTSCQSYYLCVFVTVNDAYVQYEYICPATSVFSPTTKVCTTSYVCWTA